MAAMDTSQYNGISLWSYMQCHVVYHTSTHLQSMLSAKLMPSTAPPCHYHFRQQRDRLEYAEPNTMQVAVFGAITACIAVQLRVHALHRAFL